LSRLSVDKIFKFVTFNELPDTPDITDIPWTYVSIRDALTCWDIRRAAIGKPKSIGQISKKSENRVIWILKKFHEKDEE
jgi:hypothetical protein